MATPSDGGRSLEEMEAAELLENAAQASGSAAASMRIEAATIYMEAGKLEAAVEALNGIAADAPSHSLWQRDLTLAQLYLGQGQAKQAMTLIKPPTADVSGRWRLQYLKTLVLAQDMLGDAVGAVRSLATGNEPSLHEELWRRVRALPADQLKQHATVARDAYSGWIELAIIDQDLADSAENWSTAIIFWLQQYPGHQAQKTILPLLRQQNYERHRSAGQIAVLLPRSGALLPQSSSIEYGIISAWYDDDSGQQPILRFYDTNGSDVYKLYQRAIADGAELVIGPLSHGNVDVMNVIEDLPVPLLALNTSTTGIVAAKNYYEFSLAPEQEVKQIAEKAWFGGHQAAMALMPDSKYGQRLAQVFSARWQELGGLLIPSQPLVDDRDDILQQLGELLHVRISQLRIERLEQTLGISLSAPNRHRSDISFIFLAAAEDVARQIGPHMRFLDLEHVQIYAMSDIYHGTSGDGAAHDMDLMQFPTMPWLLDPEPAGGKNMELLEGEIQYPELFAFGLDAYRLVIELKKLTAQPNATYAGATGELQVNGNKVQRKMTWAIFYGGNATTLSLYEESLDTKLQR